jgi:hypothetical protein
MLIFLVFVVVSLMLLLFLPFIMLFGSTGLLTPSDHAISVDGASSYLSRHQVPLVPHILHIGQGCQHLL